MLHSTAIDRCVEEISSTLELAQDLERQLERIHEAAAGDCAAAEIGTQTRSTYAHTKS